MGRELTVQVLAGLGLEFLVALVPPVLVRDEQLPLTVGERTAGAVHAVALQVILAQDGLRVHGLRTGPLTRLAGR